MNRFEVHNIKGKTFVTPDGVVEYDEDAFAIWDKEKKAYVVLSNQEDEKPCTVAVNSVCFLLNNNVDMDVKIKGYAKPETKFQKRNRLIKEALERYGWTQSRLLSAIKDRKLVLPVYDEKEHG